MKLILDTSMFDNDTTLPKTNLYSCINCGTLRGLFDVTHEDLGIRGIMCVDCMTYALRHGKLSHDLKRFE